MRDLKRIRFVAENYAALQGLKFVPIGLLFYFVAFRDSGFSWAPSMLQPGNQTLTLPLFALMIALYWLVGVYYRRSFGRVASVQSTDRAMLGGVVGVICVFAVYFLAAWVDAYLEPPVSFVMLAVGALLVAQWWVTGRFRSHYLVVTAVVAGIGLLPLFGVLEVTALSGTVGSGIIVGTALITVGILDHLFLVRSMGTLPAEEG